MLPTCSRHQSHHVKAGSWLIEDTLTAAMPKLAVSTCYRTGANESQARDRAYYYNYIQTTTPVKRWRQPFQSRICLYTYICKYAVVLIANYSLTVP